jgi:hypothetical protein
MCRRDCARTLLRKTAPVVFGYEQIDPAIEMMNIGVYFCYLGL